jgi:hypothetical protein
MKPEDIRALILPLDAGPQARANGISPTGQLPGNSDIRLFLASTNMLEASPAVEVLRGSAVTQIKLHLPTDAGKGWFSTPKRLVFGERDLEDNFGEEEEDEISTNGNGGRNWADLDEEEEEEDDDFIEEEVSQEEHRSLLHLLVKLCDIETITVKATEVSWNDTCVEREFCIPLNRRQCVGDVVQRIKRCGTWPLFNRPIASRLSGNFSRTFGVSSLQQVEQERFCCCRLAPFECSSWLCPFEARFFIFDII